MRIFAGVYCLWAGDFSRLEKPVANAVLKLIYADFVVL
jgi:hypothetical protein